MDQDLRHRRRPETVMAYYLSGPPECLEGTAIENWTDAEANIEEGPLEPVTSTDADGTGAEATS
jgi:hypothetical protein